MNKDRPPAVAAQHSGFSRLTKWLTRAAADNEQLLVTLHDARMNGLFDADALAMIEGVLQVDDMQVRDIMIPRTQVVMLERDASRDVLIRTIIESGHSRFPVIGDSRDEVVGILLAKDLLLYAFERNDGRLNVRDILRPAIFIPESKRLNVLLKEFRSSRNHMAMVVDEYGGVAGMVTIEDVLEQIVGEIEDEHDVEEEDTIRKHSEMHYTVKALTPVEDFNEYFGMALPNDEFDTIGGLVVHAIGHLPKRGERAVLGKLLFKVLRADSRRIHMLQLTLLPGPAEARSDQLDNAL
ncbi:MAG: CBS domain-containing protein [Gammaproteobacteria bacterium]|jgi:magnesium and cobalt transporter|nr:CBS domain-containing protein [Gammaproteobacteria bacterium]MDH3970544.1 CBS domain-containing protein [Gammaproteobacteria bacterium]MDH3985021.1 CBS domain-containing protein [Gammaproteobacteria bacterium]